VIAFVPFIENYDSGSKGVRVKRIVGDHKKLNLMASKTKSNLLILLIMFKRKDQATDNKFLYSCMNGLENPSSSTV